MTITGTNLLNATAVSIGGTAVTNFTVVSATQIAATTAAHAAGTASVLVTTAGGTNGSNTLFTYVAPPTVTAISPSSGSTAGGTSVTITGTNFLNATAVSFGGTAVTSFTVVSATQITATTAAHAAGTASVLVTTAGGTNGSNSLYTYVAPPTVTAISPSSGSTAGGTSVTITGTNFLNATAVSIGGTAVTSFTVVSATQITATTAAHAAGTASVLVTTAGGTNGSNTLFTYVAPPTVTAISPSSGSTAGGTSVTITGTNLLNATAVSIGGTAVTSFTVVSATQITATTAAHAAGTASVLVTTAGGTNGSNTLYTYVGPPTISTSSPLTAGTFDSLYSLTLAASGGATPYIWAQTGGALPGGLTLSSAGVLSGTPNAAGTFSFTVTATSTGGDTSTPMTFSLTIDKANQTITFGAQSVQTFAVAPGNTFSLNPLASVNSPLAVEYSSPTPGVCTILTAGTTVTMLSAGTCTIRASQPGNANYNAAANVDQNIAINAPTVVTPANPSAVTFSASAQNVALSASVSSTGGTVNVGTVTFTIKDSANATIGTVSGVAVSSGSASTTFSLPAGTSAGAYSISASYSGGTNFAASSSSTNGTLTVNKANQAALVASATSPIEFGASSTLGTTGGSGDGLVGFAVTSGGSFCSIGVDGVTLTGIGVGTCTVTATKAASANYNLATATVDVVVNRADQSELVATADDPILFGETSALGTIGGSGTGEVTYLVTSGEELCEITGTTLTGTGVGVCTVSATKAADDHYNVATDTIDVEVNKADQSALTATADSPIVFGETSALGTTGGSGTGEVSFAVTLGGSFCNIGVDGVTLTGTGVGTCTVTATKAASANYNVATDTIDVVVNRADQSELVATADDPILFGETSALGTIGGSGTGEVTYLVTSGEELCEITGTTLTGTGVGVCTVTATKAADDNYNLASDTVDVEVNKADQSELTATADSPIVFGGTSSLGTTGGSGDGLVSFVVTSGGSFCEITDATLTGTGVGTCTVTATKAASANYNVATDTIDVVVGKADQAELTATADSPIVFGGTSSLGTTGGSGDGLVSFAVTSGGSFCEITDATLTGTGVGTCTVTATKAASANYNVATDTIDVVVGKAGQTISFTAPADTTFTPGGTVTISATGGASGELVTFASNDTEVCTVDGNLVTMGAAGECSLTASQAGNDNYAAATPVTQSFTIGLAAQTVSLGAQSSRAFVANAKFEIDPLAMTTSDLEAFEYSSDTSAICSVSGTTVTMLAAGTCTVRATQPGDARYQSASATADIVLGNATAKLTKSVTEGTYDSIGEVLHYTLVVENTGDYQLTGIALSDGLTTDKSCPATTLAAGDDMTCSATYTIKASDMDAGDMVVNSATLSSAETGDVASNEVESARATSITGAAGTGRVKLVKKTVGGDGTFVFASSEPEFDGELTTIDGRAASADSVGVYALDASGKDLTISESDNADWTLSSVDCVGDKPNGAGRDSSASVASRTATIHVDRGEVIECTFTNTKSEDTTMEQETEQFVAQRLRNLMSVQPAKIRASRRFSGGGFASGGSNGGGFVSPVDVTGSNENGDTDLVVSTSLSRVMAYKASIDEHKIGALGAAGISEPTYKALLQRARPPLEVWFEGQYRSYDRNKDGDTSDGEFAVLFLGADYLVTDSLYIGGVIAFDHAAELVGGGTKGRIAGTGSMIGPYMGVAITDQLVFDARILWGTSQNKLAVTDADGSNPRSGAFDTKRWLAAASLTGLYTFGDLLVAPEVAVEFGEESQDAYVNSNGSAVAASSASFGRLTFGPELRYNTFDSEGTKWSPFVSLKGIWTFASSADDEGDLHGKLEAGLAIMRPDGVSFEGSMSYEAGGDDEMKIFGVNGVFRVPFN